jgi:hypothetical protein
MEHPFEQFFDLWLQGISRLVGYSILHTEQLHHGFVVQFELSYFER